jgi:hypothetical protein
LAIALRAGKSGAVTAEGTWFIDGAEIGFVSRLSEVEIRVQRVRPKRHVPVKVMFSTGLIPFMAFKQLRIALDRGALEGEPVSSSTFGPRWRQ